MSNHLSNETSPYLLQHSENPVEWYPWGEEAFSKARTEDKPIFLSIGYSTCHWCHVMAKESFEDPETAEMLNRNFVSVKVDREERPDIDGVYMAACQAMTGSGGWPMSIFMTADGKPFFAGTYFPRSARYGMPGFCDLLGAVSEAWRSDREELLRTSEAITKMLAANGKRPAANSEELVKKALFGLRRGFDRKYGGFGQAPKFPSPHILLFLLQQYEKTGDETALEMAEITLDGMYSGGLFDHIGGGFCRYSTDRRFLVPHFEKMLYDNALLILAYSKAFELTGKQAYLSAAERTAIFILREMRSPEGGFFSARDADSEGQEGSYYLFTPEEIISVLGEKKGREFNAAFDITENGNFEGKNIPNLLKNPGSPELPADQRQKLLEYREKRMRLNTDDKVLVFWNSLSIAAMCVLYRVSSKKEYLDAAVDAYDLIKNGFIKDGVLYTSLREGRTGSRAFLDDHAGLALAQLALYGATLDKAFLDEAAERVQTAVKEFFDEDSGGFFFSGTENESLIVNSKETYDGAVPSGNSIMTYVLSRLSVLVPESLSEGVLEKQIEFMSSQAGASPTGSAMFLIALSDHEEPPIKVVSVCAGEDIPKLPFILPIGADMILLDKETDGYKLLNGRQTYYVCRGHSCLPPVNELTKDLLLMR